MCFSAEASFIASGALSIVGVTAIRKLNNKKDIFVAFIPLLFALQQFTEGLLWLALGHGEMPHMQFWLTNLYGIFIGAIWPLYVPFAIHKRETDGRTRKVMTSMIFIGFCLAIYTIFGLIIEPIVAHIVNDSIYYAHDVKGEQFVLVMYLFATCAPFILSSNRYLNITGALITLGFFIAFFTYKETFASVWCFFAAVASTMLYFYVAKPKRIKQERNGGP